MAVSPMVVIRGTNPPEHDRQCGRRPATVGTELADELTGVFLGALSRFCSGGDVRDQENCEEGYFHCQVEGKEAITV
jgi:hypothetical protein